MKYRDYDVEEFSLDPFFQGWVLYPTDESEMFWGKWLQHYPEKQEIIELARELVLSLNFKDDLNVYEVTEEWDKLHTKILDEYFLYPTSVEGSGMKMLWWQSYKNIAAILAGIILGFIVYFQLPTSDTAEKITYATSYGQTKEVVLPDGSIVILNAASSISFFPIWMDDVREVWLDGEAFFSVVHTKNHQKFIVHTDEQSSVEVLGTKFNIYDRHEKVQVVLVEGKVQVISDEFSEPFIMDPGELVEWSSNTKFYTQKVNPQTYTSWKEHEINFEKAPLGEVAQTLKDINGVEVHFKDSSLRELNFTGTLSTNDLDNFLISLSKSFKLLVKHEGNQVILDKMKK